MSIPGRFLPLVLHCGMRTEGDARRGGDLAPAAFAAVELHLRLLGDLEGILHLDADVSDGALELRMPEEELDDPGVPRVPVGQRRLGPTPRAPAWAA